MNIKSIRWKLLISMLSLISINLGILTYVLLHLPNPNVIPFVITIISLLIISFIVILLVSTSISKPIVELTDSVRLLASGNFSARIPMPRFGEQDEVSQLVTTFSQLGKKFKRSYKELEDKKLHLEDKVVAVSSEQSKILQDMTESFEYVKLVQLSLLPNMQMVNTYLPKHFFIWQPKEQVGGDMLYMDFFENGFIVALIECSGDSVPAACLSMIVMTSLKKITRDEGCHVPGEILHNLNIMVKTSLQQDSDDATSDEGLKAAICWINPSKKTLFFAGAELPLYYIYNDQLSIIAGEKQSLAYQKSKLDFQFTTHLVKIEQSISFYMSSNGLLDQIGGSERMPFGNKRFRNLLMQHHQCAFEEQSDKILKNFNKYKAKYDRTDNVTVMGFNLEYEKLSMRKKQKTARDFIILPKKEPNS